MHHMEDTCCLLFSNNAGFNLEGEVEGREERESVHNQLNIANWLGCLFMLDACTIA